MFKKISFLVCLSALLFGLSTVVASPPKAFASSSTSSAVFNQSVPQAKTEFVRGGRGSFGSGRSFGSRNRSGGNFRGFGGFGGLGTPFLFLAFGGGGIALVLFLIFVLPLLMGSNKNSYARTSTRSSRKLLGLGDKKIVQKIQAREEEVRGRMLVAAEDDPDFEHAHVVKQSVALVELVQNAWNERDRKTLKSLLGETLYREWDRRLKDFEARGWKDKVSFRSQPEAHIVGFENHQDDRMDRVVIVAKMDLDETVYDEYGQAMQEELDSPFYSSGPVYEFWTLGKKFVHSVSKNYDKASVLKSGWVLLSIEQLKEGAYHLDKRVVENESESQEFEEDSRLEVALADASLSEEQVKDLVHPDFEENARVALLDAALLDDRFSPAVVEASVAKAIRAWTVAVDSDKGVLQNITTKNAQQRLLYGSQDESTRTVVRGANIEKSVVSGFETEGENSLVTVDIDYKAVWYREDRDTLQLLEGNRNKVSKQKISMIFVLNKLGHEPIWVLQDTKG